MAFDAYIKFDGIDGEATDDKHKKWIKVDSFSWGISNNVDVIGSALSSGKANVQDFSFSKQTDSSSPKLALSCCTGDHIKSLDLELVQSSGARQTWLHYTFTECMLSNFGVGGAPGGADRPSESFSVAFGQWEIKYWPSDDKGVLGGVVPAKFDCKTNKKV